MVSQKPPSSVGSFVATVSAVAWEKKMGNRISNPVVTMRFLSSEIGSLIFRLPCSFSSSESIFSILQRRPMCPANAPRSSFSHHGWWCPTCQVINGSVRLTVFGFPSFRSCVLPVALKALFLVACLLPHFLLGVGLSPVSRRLLSVCLVSRRCRPLPPENASEA